MSLVYYVCSIPLGLSPERYGITTGSQVTVDVTGIICYVCSIPLRDMVAKKDLRTLLMSLVYYVCSIPPELFPERYGRQRRISGHC